MQTNFGGGKTHSMLALYHLYSGLAPHELAGMDDMLAEAGVESVVPARCLVLGQPDFARQSRHRAGRHQGARTAGRVGLAARRRGGIRAGAGGRRERHQTGRRAAGTVQGLRTVAGADRRMGSLCAPVARRGRSASRRFRDTILMFAQALTESAELVENCLLPTSGRAGSSSRACADLCRAQRAKFPAECHAADDERCIRSAGRQATAGWCRRWLQAFRASTWTRYRCGAATGGGFRPVSQPC